MIISYLNFLNEQEKKSKKKHKKRSYKDDQRFPNDGKGFEDFETFIQNHNIENIDRGKLMNSPATT